MIPETFFQQGSLQKPLAIFIHGMGLNVSAWSDPAAARVLGGKYPLRILAGVNERDLETSFSDLKKQGYPVLAWTQTRPSGPINVAVEELKYLVKKYGQSSRAGVILIGHSRGGLIARKYMEEAGGIRSLITIATPNHGTTLARWGVFLSPAAYVLGKFLEGFSRREVDSAFKKILAFLCSTGLKEMLPGSVFFRNLRDTKLRETIYISIGGTSPDLLKGLNLALPELIASLAPNHIIPEEMRPGLGDGIVSSSSSTLPFADEHRNFAVNHAAVLFDTEVRKYVLEKVDSLY